MRFPTPEETESTFYAAFETRNLDAMMRVWAQDESIVCIHPMAAPLNGHAAVSAGWRSMFEAATHFQVQAELMHELRTDTLIIRIVREFLTIGQETESRPPIHATNAYRKLTDGWLMVLHHASPLHIGGASSNPSIPTVLH